MQTYMMKRNVILACTIVAINLAQITAQDQPAQPLQKALFGMIGTMQSASKTAVNAMKTPVQGFSEASKQALHTIQKTKSGILAGGTDTFKQGIGAAADALNILNLPGMSALTNTGKKAINTAADLTNLAGQALLHAESAIFNDTADGISGLAQHSANYVHDSIDTAAEVANQVVKHGINAVEAGAMSLQNANEHLDALSEWSQFMAELLALSDKNK